MNSLQRIDYFWRIFCVLFHILLQQSDCVLKWTHCWAQQFKVNFLFFRAIFLCLVGLVSCYHCCQSGSGYSRCRRCSCSSLPWIWISSCLPSCLPSCLSSCCQGLCNWNSFSFDGFYFDVNFHFSIEKENNFKSFRKFVVKKWFFFPMPQRVSKVL